MKVFMLFDLFLQKKIKTKQEKLKCGRNLALKMVNRKY